MNIELKDAALILANVRLNIKRTRMTNAELYMNTFATGFGTARERCLELGLNPDDNITSYNDMMNFID